MMLPWGCTSRLSVVSPAISAQRLAVIHASRHTTLSRHAGVSAMTRPRSSSVKGTACLTSSVAATFRMPWRYWSKAVTVGSSIVLNVTPYCTLVDPLCARDSRKSGTVVDTAGSRILSQNSSNIRQIDARCSQVLFSNRRCATSLARSSSITSVGFCGASSLRYTRSPVPVCFKIGDGLIRSTGLNSFPTPTGAPTSIISGNKENG
ncbi:hypothetical protein ABB37_07498 [Leptomonas pyrrhocoris]|uniref:Uncharacterized protein n=1 Tax=Leptomonas pyrrhocoris TaxID=157538 RepID=A0A0N0DSX5_LEPPY|nr:hypothetical protein ABB37_07498 [Leptomonas pyrrhocoris]KPA76641.1 hypothetical protein ABB37_07498 [Leptomonas pyrrhocoris]|eukprot:XP_015655080.1 hypothetical protein ABB37_07498 [Leptomonas pyrrhocoris]